MKKITAFLLIITIYLLLSGCGISSGAMVPDLDSRNGFKIDKTLNIAEVTGGNNNSFVMGQVSDDQFKDALITTLEQARIFKGISEGNGEIRLFVKIRGQEIIKIEYAKHTDMIIVDYRLVNAKDGREIWHKTYRTEFSSALAGYPTISDAREGSVRENLLNFITDLNQESWQ